MSEDHAPMQPPDLLCRIFAIYPAFEQEWYGPENYFKNEDGSFTYCGVFSEFSHYVRAGYESFTPSSLASLGELLSECMADSNSNLSEAAATCFLENMTSEDFSASLAQHLSGNPLKYFSQFLD